MLYFTLKYLHVIGATLLLGTGAGIAFFMLMAHRTGDPIVVAAVARIVVLADFLFTAFNAHEKQAKHLMEQQLALPAYEQVLKCAHSFNLLDARGAISVTERAAYIGRIRNLARSVAQSYYESRERLGFPMAPREWVAQIEKKAA